MIADLYETIQNTDRGSLPVNRSASEQRRHTSENLTKAHSS